MEKTPEDEEFERMLAKIDLQHTPSKDSQLVSLRRWEIDEMIRLAVLAEREECAKLCDLTMLQNQEAINELEDDEHIAKCFIQGAMTQLVKTAKAIRARGQE